MFHVGLRCANPTYGLRADRMHRARLSRRLLTAVSRRAKTMFHVGLRCANPTCGLRADRMHRARLSRRLLTAVSSTCYIPAGKGGGIRSSADGVRAACPSLGRSPEDAVDSRRFRVLSSAGRASPLQGEGRGFEPLSTHQLRSDNSTLIGVVVQLVRIPACHAGGRGFESRPLRQRFAVTTRPLAGASCFVCVSAAPVCATGRVRPVRRRTTRRG